LVKSIDRTYLRPKTHPAVGAFILINLNIDPPGNFLMPPKILDPPKRTIRKTSLTANASIFSNLHKNLLPTVGLLKTYL
jgi:hypothetical protein